MTEIPSLHPQKGETAEELELGLESLGGEHEGTGKGQIWVALTGPSADGSSPPSPGFLSPSEAAELRVSEGSSA